MQFETKRLRLRPICLDDKYKIFEYRSDAETNKYQGQTPKNIEDVEDFIAGVSEQINIPGSWFQFVIIDRTTRNIIGDLGIHFFDSANLQVEVGCTLNKLFHNKGYATEALIRIIKYLFEDLHKHRIIASIDPNNTSSIRLVERIGFRKEAHFIESIFSNGKWVDDLIYALIDKDWEALSLKMLNTQ